MFGYVTPCKMELKIKDYEKFKAYYCGLCISIKNNFGELPRVTLNYDMTFLAVLLDSLCDEKRTLVKNRCIAHPIKKRSKIINNKAIDYAALCNTSLAYYKLLDDVQDNHSLKSKFFSIFLKQYLKKFNGDYNLLIEYIENKLNELYKLESSCKCSSLDELSHPFADLTGFIISFYYKDSEFKENLYWLGYNLGKWIYLIDAFDDLEKDMKNKCFNAINNTLNKNNKDYINFSKEIKDRIEFSLTSCAEQCLQYLNNIPLKKNEDLLYNILQYGLMEKMDIIMNRSEINNGKSI